MKKVTAIYKDGTLVEVEPVLSRDGFAVIVDDRWYIILHAASGVGITRTATLGYADEAIAILADIRTPAGVKLADLPGCELLSLASWAQSEYAKRVSPEVSELVLSYDATARAAAMSGALECGGKP